MILMSRPPKAISSARLGRENHHAVFQLEGAGLQKLAVAFQHRLQRPHCGSEDHPELAIDSTSTLSFGSSVWICLAIILGLPQWGSAGRNSGKSPLNWYKLPRSPPSKEKRYGIPACYVRHPLPAPRSR